MSGMLRLRSMDDLLATQARINAAASPLAAVDQVERVLAHGAVRKRDMNRTEAAYGTLLERRKVLGEVAWFDFEAVTLKLADDTRYTPDFPVLLADGTIEMHEVKGHMRDDAWVKLKLAARLFPFRFILVRRVAKNAGGGWTFQEV